MAHRLKEKAAIVVGAGAAGPTLGNGQAAAILFAREGARVACVDVTLELAQATCDAVKKEGGEAFPIAADISRAADCQRLADEAAKRLGPIHILHNNVGINSTRGILDVTEEEWDHVLGINLKGMMLTARAVVPHIIKAGGGSIINISSVAALRGGRGRIAYASSKAGVIGFTTSLAWQLGKDRIRANVIVPGLVYSSMSAALPEMTPELRDQRRQASVIPEEGTPWDVAWAAVFLASDESRWVTGQVLAVDGGQLITTRSPARPR